MTRQPTSLRHACLASVLLLIVSAMPVAQTAVTPERYVATAVNLGQPGPTGPWTVEMVINRWSTDAERDRLISRLIQKGPEALLETLRELPRVGYIRTPDSLGYDLHFARKQPLGDGGERVSLATDRYISFWEATQRPRTVDYPFTYIELRLGPDGMGEGRMSIFTKIVYDKKENAIVLENYGTQPVLMQNVRKETGR